MKRIGLIILTATLSLLLFVSCGERAELDYKVILGENFGENEDFYVIASEKYAELDILHVQYSNGTVLFTVRNYLTGDVGISTYNIHTGARSEKISGNTASAMLYKSGFLPGGEIYTFDGASNLLTFYDDRLNETRKTNFVNITVSELFVSNEYALTLSGGVLSRVTLSNNAVEELCKFMDPASVSSVSASSLRFIGTNGDEVYISGYDDSFVDRLYSCNIKSGECADMGNFDGKLLLRDGFAVNDNYNGNTYSIYEYDRPSVLSSLYLDETGEQLLGAGKGKVCTSLLSGDDLLMKQTLRVYSLEKGRLIAKCDYEYDISVGGTNIRDAFVVDDNFILFEIMGNKESKIVVWKYSDTPANPSDSRNLIAGSISDIQKDKNEELIQSIYEKYGVNIIVGDDAVRFYPDYVAVPEDDPKTLASALSVVENTLAKFPDGFFRELIKKGAHKDLRIVLCDSLLPSHTASLDSAAGYYTELETQYILLSLSGADIENTLSHELMHAIESAMSLNSHSPFDDWKNYNPDGFEYKNSYVDENGFEYDNDTLGANTPYDIASIENLDNVAFFDYYSKTFEKEDRARIFEMLMRDELSSYFESKPLKQKAAYLCRQLDLFFDCVNADTDVYWERIVK